MKLLNCSRQTNGALKIDRITIHRMNLWPNLQFLEWHFLPNSRLLEWLFLPNSQFFEWFFTKNLLFVEWYFLPKIGEVRIAVKYRSRWFCYVRLLIFLHWKMSFYNLTNHEFSKKSHLMNPIFGKKVIRQIVILVNRIFINHKFGQRLIR